MAIVNLGTIQDYIDMGRLKIDDDDATLDVTDFMEAGILKKKSSVVCPCSHVTKLIRDQSEPVWRHSWLGNVTNQPIKANDNSINHQSAYDY